jgi:hypothetical protein
VLFPRVNLTDKVQSQVESSVVADWESAAEYRVVFDQIQKIIESSERKEQIISR